MPERAAAWSSALSPKQYGKLVAAQAVGEWVVLAFHEGVTVLDRNSGKTRWERAAELGDPETPVRVTDDAVVLIERHRTSVFDLATGEKRFSRAYEDVPDFVGVTDEVLITSRCPGHDCELSASGLHSGSRRWTRTYSSGLRVFIGTEDPDRQAGETRRDPLLAPKSNLVSIVGAPSDEGAGEVIAIVDAATGREVSRRKSDAYYAALLTDDVYVTWDRPHQCAYRVTAYGVRSQRRLWRLGVSAKHWEDWEDCPKSQLPLFSSGAGWWPAMAGGSLLTYTRDGKPALVEVATGEVTWSGRTDFRRVDFDNGVVTAVDRNGDGDIVAADAKTGAERWRSPSGYPNTEDFRRGTAAAGKLIWSTEVAGTRRRGVLWTYDLRTGRKQICEGNNLILGAGDNWLIGGLQDDFRKYELRYFKL